MKYYRPASKVKRKEYPVFEYNKHGEGSMYENTGVAYRKFCKKHNIQVGIRRGKVA